MQAQQLLETFTAAGLAVSLTPENGLKVVPAKALTDDLRGTIKVHKAELVAYLRRCAANDPGKPIGPTEAPTTTDPGKRHSQPVWSAQEVETFGARLERFTERGIGYGKAESIAEELVTRDREQDDRRLCLECTYLKGGPMGWRCGQWPLAGVSREGVAPALVLMLQRCDRFTNGVAPFGASQKPENSPVAHQ